VNEDVHSKVPDMIYFDFVFNSFNLFHFSVPFDYLVGGWFALLTFLKNVRNGESN